MKKYFLVLGVTMVAFQWHIHAQAQLATISGQAKESNSDGMKLFEVIDGKRVEYGTTKLDADKRFAFSLPAARPGYYYVSPSKEGKTGMDFIRFYLKPGEQLELNLDKKNNGVLVKGGAENKVLFAWETLALPLRSGYRFWGGDMGTYRSFFPALEAVLPQAEAFKKKINSGNAAFDNLLKMTVDADVEYACLSLLCTPRTAHPPKDTVYPAYYSTILKPGRYCNTAILQLGNGASLLDRYINVYSMKQPEAKTTLSQEERLAAQIKLICNDTLKGTYLALKFPYYKGYEQLQAVVQPYKQYLLLPSDKQAYFDALKAVSTFKAGTAGFNFSYPDINNTKVSLKDLKGKVVLVDVWATWCGPCKGEIPHLQKLEEELKGKDVAFVSISVDEEKDKEKWKQFVADQKLGGIQLFAAGWSDVVKFYNITGIPRFMVFDKNGNIVSVDAPRPSTPDLKAMIEKAMGS